MAPSPCWALAIGAVYLLTILSKQDHCASRVKKRGLHDRQYIGPL